MACGPKIENVEAPDPGRQAAHGEDPRPGRNCRLRIASAVLTTTFGLLAPILFPSLAGAAPPVTGAAAAGSPPLALTLLPPEVTLDGRHAEQQLLAVRTSVDESFGEPGDVVFTSDDPGVVTVGDDGRAFARGNGVATVTARSGDESATVTVTVGGFGAPVEWSFRNHVLPVLSRAGCNSGGCHGALAGKGGFRLSLQGYDPVSDYRTITREARGRRIETASPGRSLLLSKPTAAVRHKGGKKLEPGSPDYRTVSGWIAGGAPPPRADDPRLETIEVFPPHSVLGRGDGSRLIVRARYSDGREEDVTRWCKFASADETVATVDEDGNVSVAGYGEGAITAWFSSKIVIARITAPFPNKVSESVFAASERRNFIDEHVVAQLRRLNLKPSPPAGDSEFLRRAHLDTTGMIPTPEAVQKFLADTSEAKRSRLVDELLESDAFIDYWTYKWADILLVNGDKLRPDAVKAYYGWIRQRVEENTPWDAFARQLVTAAGGSLENGATNFFAVHQDPETMAENVSKAFLSLSINCAKCHNHPLEKWTNDQYYAFANLFSRVRAKGWGGESRNGDGKRTLFAELRGELIQPSTGKAQPPAPLDGAPVPEGAPGDRRRHLATWLTSPENPYFSRAITNRVWANFFGVGLVEPVDDLRVSNPASNDELLEAASNHLVEHGFDLKELMREILNSATYQRSSSALPENKDESRFYSRYYPRRLMAEVLHDAIVTVTGVPTEFNEIAFSGGDKQKTTFYPLGTRALQLYDSAVASYFLKTFGRNERAITCECERSNEPSMVQVLHLSNGETINKKLSAGGSRVSGWIAEGRDDDRIIADAFLLTVARTPTGDEHERLRTILAAASLSADEKRAVVEDLFWALMSSREFLFNH